MRIIGKTLFVLGTVLLLSFSACVDSSPEDPAGETPQGEAPVYDASGDWIISMVYVQDYGLNDCELVPNISYDVITQSGSSFSLDGQEGGVIDGSDYTFQYSYTPSTGVTCTVTFLFTMSSEDTFKGTTTIYVTNGSDSAERILNTHGTRAGNYDYDATGTWRIDATIVGINYCGKQVKRTFNISMDQEDFLFEITADLDNDTITEKLYGAVVAYDYEGIYTSDDGSSKAIVINYNMTSANSLSGTLEIYNCSGTDCKTTYDITGTRVLN